MINSFKILANSLLALGLLINADELRSQTSGKNHDAFKKRLARFENQVDDLRTLLKIPGLSAVVIKNQEVLWAKGFGYADVENRIAATPDTVYHIASLTKTFAAELVMWRKNLPHNISSADGRRVRSSPRQPDPIAAKSRSITASRDRSYSVVNARCLTNDRWSECPAASAHTSATRAMHWGQSIRAERLARISQNEDHFIEKSFEKPVIKSGSRLV